jgi:hypothetical protein
MTYRRSLAPILPLLACLVACGGPGSSNQARKVGKDAKLDDDAPVALTDVQFVESARDGNPIAVGCADGQREGYADMQKFPDIAGCLGVWDGEKSLRKGKTSKACGDDLEVCGSPSDVCAEGWHLCARDGDYHDLTNRITWQECNEGAGPGKFVAAISHVLKKKECAPEPGANTRYPCLDEGYGAEPICCGELCKQGECKDSVWPAQTRISMGKAEGCAAVTSERNGGLLCCRDPGTVVPQVIAPTDPPPTGVPPEGGVAEGGAAPTEGGVAEGGAAPTEGGAAPDPKADPTGEKKPDEKKPDEKADAKKEG